MLALVKMIALIVGLTLLSGFADSQGFLHAAHIWVERKVMGFARLHGDQRQHRAIGKPLGLRPERVRSPDLPSDGSNQCRGQQDDDDDPCPPALAPAVSRNRGLENGRVGIHATGARIDGLAAWISTASAMAAVRTRASR